MKDSPLARRPWILGIDLGPNSLGWCALAVSHEGEPAGTLHPPEDMASWPTLGVRIFEAGVGHYGEGEREESRGVKRRMARLQRRQIMRRARRMKKTFRVLQHAGLLPAFEEGAIRAAGGAEAARDALLKELDHRIAIELTPVLPQGNERQVHELLPYVLRARGLDHRLSLEQLGRALYHLAQRRGFLSNRKSGKKDEDEGAVKQGISDLSKAIKEGGSRTLGEHLFAEGCAGKRIRRRWTHRDMYREEFDTLWSAQVPLHPAVLTPELGRRLRQVIFHQRPLKSQRDLIGNCELENGGEYVHPTTGVVQKVSRRRRAPECLLVSQRFRLVQKVNDLAITDGAGRSTPLAQEQRGRLIAELEKTDNLSFAAVKKLLGLQRSSRFNLQEGGDKGIKGNRINARLTELFGDRWTQLSPSEKNEVVLELWSAHDDAAVVKRARERKGVWSRLAPTRTEAEELREIPISGDYMSLSRRAMERLLPKMETGSPYITAVRDVYGEPVSREPLDILPPLKTVMQDLRNPAVLRALNELRRVVNFLVQWYGKPEQIRIELARDLKKGKKDRKRIQDENRKREEERRRLAERIIAESHVQNPGAKDVLLAQLWTECGGICPYTGRPIGFAQLFGADVDIEHIIPFSICLDDSYLNKTLCFAHFNRSRKKNKTPYETLQVDPDAWDSAVLRMEGNVDRNGMHEEKLRRFQLKGPDLIEYCDNFKASQLNDTRHASLRAKEYLALLYGGNLAQGTDPQGKKRIQVGNGQATALLRKLLGINRILEVEGGDKRSDHRHHAVDAVAIALTGPSTIQKLSKNAEENWRERKRLFGPMPAPWPSFEDQIRNAVERTVVSFRIDNRVRGPLHAETLYSMPRTSSGEPSATGEFSHVRKPLESLSTGEVEDIVDERVRKLVIEALQGREPKKVFNPDDPSTYPSMRTWDERTIPICRARIRKKNSTSAIAADHRRRFVENSENHHVAIIARSDKKGRARWEGEVVSLAVAHARKEKKLPIVERPDGFQFALAKNDLIELEDADGERRLHTVRGFSQFNNGTIQLAFSRNTDARPISKVPKEGRTATPDVLRSRNCRKLTVLPIGVVRPCRA